MYKQKKTSRLEKSRRPIYWLKRKILLITTALMLGMSNSINNEDKSVFEKNNELNSKIKND
ncbi:hypothetical protein [Polaribacter ponticola]|uniref:Uncharacterized protein n=1 Tax=Polaribacter ponticola TaxID=2978475 RepID=A0ABT5S912_9FLAO|nr:hypothetical protein [Polaribacter sp. MSW5]MDD7914607.1 hypothetical protein [Polaribacter sp. MSW5]